MDNGYLAALDGPYGRYPGSDLRTSGEIYDLPCLALLGKSGISKTSAMRSEWGAVGACAKTAGDEAIWMNLGAYGNEGRLVRKLRDAGCTPRA